MPALCPRPAACGATCEAGSAEERAQATRHWGAVGAGTGVLMAQVVSGLLSDDEIAFSGPLTPLRVGRMGGRATWFHADVGRYLVIGLVALHLLAIAYYTLVRRKPWCPHAAWRQRLVHWRACIARRRTHPRGCCLVLAACAAWWVAGLGAV